MKTESIRDKGWWIIKECLESMEQEVVTIIMSLYEQEIMQLS
jgi:hypothetical protein